MSCAAEIRKVAHDEKSEEVADIENSRTRSMSCSHSCKSGKGIHIKSGIVKKKGLLFYNDRMLVLDLSGTLSYYDLKKSQAPKG